MDEKFLSNTALLKAFADPNRLLIIETLARNENCTCGEFCACRLLENLGISQPTLSHHMKILCDCGIASGRREGKWTFYTLNHPVIDELLTFLRNITSASENCICCDNTKKEVKKMSDEKVRVKPDNGCDNPDCFCEPCECEPVCECTGDDCVTACDCEPVCECEPVCCCEDK